jgi:hypothetical protein
MLGPGVAFDSRGVTYVPPAPQDVGTTIYDFELDAKLEPANSKIAAASLLTWDASANGGYGGWSTGGASITVITPNSKDWGIPGERGKAVKRTGDNGTVYEIVRNPGQPQYHGKLDANLTVGGSALCSVYIGDPLADSTYKFTVLSPPLMSAQIDINKWVRIQCFPQEGAVFKVTGAPCP